ncbi:hypothetical protein ACIGCH_02255 [Pseudomonas helleri]|uniref:Uncharacterized protein n=1 Tax=Pseudomonas helleri TaxID=1608996 RepID=A0A6G1WAU7_9PSED|nr:MULTISPECIES: hypothetical protein [Pseudomonas]MQT28177.1 hypothetical protein [Pseudomonas helleri]MQU16290.1 hypothetical protein [Pseudomonas helleri]NMY75335.1 hypothetical protein [Pseudomonas sp. WS 5071]
MTLITLPNGALIIDDSGLSQDAEAARLIADGLSLTELMAALGCSAETAAEYFAGYVPLPDEDE